jgi:hypothetical protein
MATSVVSTPAVCTTDFDSRAWLEYYERNRTERFDIPWQQPIAVEEQLRGPLIHSLQRFQVGESGDGAHLRKGAARVGDDAYYRSIELFVAEEQEHSRLLAHVLDGIGGRLIDGHWSDTVFILLRRLMGLKLEIMILLVAEMIAKRYYRALHDSSADPVLRGVFAQIIHDEVGHVRFHCDYLRSAFRAHSSLRRWFIVRAWWIVFRAACIVVAFDHRAVLRACGVSTTTFWRDTGTIFAEAVGLVVPPHHA